MRAIFVDSTGRIVGAKDLVAYPSPPPQRMRGVVEIPPSSPDVGTTSRRRKRNPGSHDPERDGGLLNGRSS